MSALSYKRRGNGGFSLVELLVTVVLAGIIFLAMVPLFVSVLKKSSTDTRRVVATNLAQARVDKVKMLAYADITPDNLNSATFAAGQFNTSFTPAKGGQPYTITTTVTTPTPTAAPPYKTISVTVSRSGDSYSTKVTTNIMNPIQVTSTSTSGTGDPHGPFSITAAFKSSAEVTSGGVVVIQYAMNSATPTPVPTATVTISPTLRPATSPITSTVTWPSLPGGMGYVYSVTCHNSSSASPTETSPLFHLLSNSWLKFDTNPGGS